jgi:hypothetical protein
MKKLKILSGIVWAFAGLVLIIILFPALNGFAGGLSKMPFMKINDRYSGGEVAFSRSEALCTLDVRKPVFNGLFSERKTGFVQVDWKGSVPERINDTIDYNGDGKKDFCIFINTKDAKTDLVSLDSKVRGLVISTPTSYGWAARVELVK